MNNVNLQNTQYTHHACSTLTHTGSEHDHLPRVMIGVAVELAGSYHTELSPGPPAQSDLVTDAQFLVDAAEVSCW